MITESKVTEVLCIADDFCKEFEVEMAKNALASFPEAPKRRRKRMMSDAEVITILIFFHFNTYRNFKHYYRHVYVYSGGICSLAGSRTAGLSRSCRVVSWRGQCS